MLESVSSPQLNISSLQIKLSLGFPVLTGKANGEKAINMGKVVISPNIKRESVRINTNGDIIDPRTKQIIKPNTPDPVAPIALAHTEPPQEKPEDENPIAGMIKKQVQEAVLSSIKEIDIKAIVNEALKEALK